MGKRCSRLSPSSIKGMKLTPQLLWPRREKNQQNHIHGAFSLMTAFACTMSSLLSEICKQAMNSRIYDMCYTHKITLENVSCTGLNCFAYSGDPRLFLIHCHFLGELLVAHVLPVLLSDHLHHVEELDLHHVHLPPKELGCGLSVFLKGLSSVFCFFHGCSSRAGSIYLCLSLCL